MKNLDMVATKPCCEEVTESNKKNPVQNRHQWLDPQLIEKLPVPIKRGESSRCGDADVGGDVTAVCLCQCCVKPAGKHRVLLVCCLT